MSPPLPEPDSSTVLSLRLFGPLEAWVEGRPLPRLRTRKGHWLLALLALSSGRAIDRGSLAGRLWPEVPERQAYQSLRRCLADLRAALGTQAARLHSPTSRSLALDPTGTWTDVAAFDHALTLQDGENLRRACGLYRGPLLEGCEEEWVLSERGPRQEAWLRAMELIAEEELSNGSSAEAVFWLKRALRSDPLRETAVRTLMRAHQAGGAHSAALEYYRDFREFLRREMNTDPAPETATLFQEIRSEARTRAQATARPPVGAAGIAGRDGYLGSSLPLHVSPFVGRARELGEVAALLSERRLLTLTGAGGVGKTRLAVEAARGFSEGFAGSIRFADLTTVESPQLIQRVADAVGLSASSERDQSSLSRFLAPRQMLLVLDNCEALTTQLADILGSLLASAPGLRILCTSRHAIELPGEVVWRVPSMALPGEGILDPERLRGVDSVALFVAQAGSAFPSFRLSDGNAKAVVSVCSRLDGIPLALEFAAARLRALSVQEIASRLQSSFQLLDGRSGSTTRRHRTLRASMEWSFDLLTQEERSVFARLSVFIGPFTLGAAESVCAEPGDRQRVLPLLASLVDKSLLIHDPHEGESRYRLLETTREYAGERLSTMEASGRTRDRHATHYTRMVNDLLSDLTGARQPAAFRMIRTELSNLRGAARRLAESGRIEEGVDLACNLVSYWIWEGGRQEGCDWLRRLLASAEPESRARARALCALCVLQCAELAWDEGRRYGEESLHLFRSLGDEAGCADASLHTGWANGHLGRLREARRLGEAALDFYRRTGSFKSALALETLAFYALHAGDYTLGLDYCERASEVCRLHDRHSHIHRMELVRALLHHTAGNADQARAACLRARDLAGKGENKNGVLWATATLAQVELGAGCFELADSLYHESLLGFHAMGSRDGLRHCVAGLIQVGMSPPSGVDRVSDAVRHFGALEAIRRCRDCPDESLVDTVKEHQIHYAVAVLGQRGYEQAFRSGEALSLDDIVAALAGQGSGGC